jgi:hypothetical protein
MMKYSFAISCMVMIVLQACQKNKDHSSDEQQIRELLASERKAHMERNVDMFVQEFSDSLYSVNKGTIKATPPDSMRKSISRYFGAVQFIKWDDTTPPVIRFSDDGSLAYALVQKEVIVSYPGDTGTRIIDTTHFAWASVYRKENSGWKLEANISTNK